MEGKIHAKVPKVSGNIGTRVRHFLNKKVQGGFSD